MKKRIKIETDFSLLNSTLYKKNLLIEFYCNSKERGEDGFKVIHEGELDFICGSSILYIEVKTREKFSTPIIGMRIAVCSIKLGDNLIYENNLAEEICHNHDSSGGFSLEEIQLLEGGLSWTVEDILNIKEV
jgi:hypothetical protein